MQVIFVSFLITNYIISSRIEYDCQNGRDTLITCLPFLFIGRPFTLKTKGLKEQGYMTTSDSNYIIFQVQGCNHAQLGMAEFEGDTSKNTYDVVIGGDNNARSFIRNRNTNQELVSSGKAKVLSCDALRYFWVGWAANMIRVGEGNLVGENKLMETPSIDDMDISSVTVTSKSDALWMMEICPGKNIAMKLSAISWQQLSIQMKF